jgi:TonB family protein
MALRAGFILAFHILFFAPIGSAQLTELQQRISNQYKGKVFVLRGFDFRDKIHYDSAGTPAGKPSRGFWTMHGFVLVDEADLRGQAIEIRAHRMLIISHGHGFQFQPDDPKKWKNGSPLEINVDLGLDTSEDHISSVLNKIFLTDHDSFLTLLPSYWRTCVSAGLNRVNDHGFASCQFSAQLWAVPGMNANVDLRMKSQDEPGSPGESETVQVMKVGSGVSAPRMISSPEPQYSEVARALNLAGVVTLSLVVDNKGMPHNIEILSPLGAGLDEEAIAAIEMWRFKPAEKKGQGPVAVKIAVEVDFHL